MENYQNNSNNHQFKFQKKGVNKNGIEVYETSKETMDLSWKERVSVFEYELNGQYANKTARFVRNGHTYYAKLDESFFDKVVYGESHFSKNGKKAFIKAGADGDVFDLIENATYKRSAVDTKDHKKKDGFTDYFDYFFKTVQIDNKVFDICVNVKKQYGTKDGYTYTMFLVDNNKITASPSISTQSAFKSEGNAFTDDIISEEEPIVKNQLKKTSGKNYLDTVKESDTGIKKQMKRDAYASGEYREPINIADVKALKAIVAKRGKISLKDLSDGEIEALQKWAYKYWSNPQTKTKSPFFRAWFGDWRESTKFDVEVVDTKSDNRKDVVNEDTGWTVKASRQVHKETSNHKGSAEVNAVKYLPYIDDITKKVILFDSVLSDKDNENSLMFHTMYAYTEAMGYPALLKLKVEELFYFSNTESGVFQRDYILQNIEEESLSKRNRLSRPNHLKKDSSVISIADLYDIVKRYEKNFIPSEASKVVNPDGTPMIVYHGSNMRDIDVFQTTKRYAQL